MRSRKLRFSLAAIAGAALLGSGGSALASSGVMVGEFDPDWNSATESLVLIDPSTGVTTPITDGSAADRDPRFTPDGRTVVFDSTRGEDPTAPLVHYHLWKVDLASGALTQLTSGPDSIDTLPAVSPDGTRLAFDRLGQLANGQWQWDVWTMRVDGSGIRRLTTSAGQDSAAQFTPDGRFILYSHEGPNGRGRVLRMDAATGAHKTRVTRTGFYVYGRPSPDGTRLLYDQAARHGVEHIWVSAADGSGATELAFPDWYQTAVAWSPDGSRILVRSVSDTVFGFAGFSYWTANVDGSDQQRLPLAPGVLPWDWKASPPG